MNKEQISALLFIISEWLVNLSAGWLAAAAIFHVAEKLPRKINLGLLTINFLLAILALVLAFFLRIQNL